MKLNKPAKHTQRRPAYLFKTDGMCLIKNALRIYFGLVCRFLPLIHFDGESKIGHIVEAKLIDYIETN